ncbi:MAG: NAD(P)/FAD-dependent oxidoreductase [Rubrivivax sp.]
MHRIVIVGGGAGGLELATRLGDGLGRKGRAEITLIDKARSHLWKPKLHEVAAGSMDVGLHEVSFRAQAHWHGFRFRIGELTGIDRQRREVQVAPFVDEDGTAVTPARSFGYDTLVLAIGSQSNDFRTPGVAEHALKLETMADARAFHRRLVNACIRAHAQGTPLAPQQLQVAIIGAGATGVELAAELHHSARELIAYGLDRIDADKDLQLHLIEAAPRILPGLPERVSAAAQLMLQGLGVHVHTGARVAEVLPGAVRLEGGPHHPQGRVIPAELVVWAAGVKAAEVLRDIAGLETNALNQLVVRPTLQTTRDDDIFALGDCAACWRTPELAAQGGEGRPGGPAAMVPPRAQAAHQQASLMVHQVGRRLAGRPLLEYRYRDFGSLVSLGELNTVGSMAGRLSRAPLVFEGWVARWMYLSLYKMHEVALHGYAKAALDTLVRFITRRTEPHVKLH